MDFEELDEDKERPELEDVAEPVALNVDGF